MELASSGPEVLEVQVNNVSLRCLSGSHLDQYVEYLSAMEVPAVDAPALEQQASWVVPLVVACAGACCFHRFLVSVCKSVG